MNDCVIGVESPLTEDVRAMIAELNSVMRPLTPRRFQFQMTAEQMAGPETTLFVARDTRGNALGMGALKLHGERLGEVKRMYTRPVVRGSGVGHAILQHIIGLASTRGVAKLVLETGEAPGFTAAYAVYERAGFSRCGAVLDYPDSGWSRFYEFKLPQEERVQ